MSVVPGMLSRVADSLFWIGRQIDRAENIARLADAARRIEAMPSDDGVEQNEWASALISAGLRDTEDLRISHVSREFAVHMLFFERSNPSSVYNCLFQARENARSVRTDLTQEVWETLNHGWRSYGELEEWETDPSALSKLIDWIKGFSAQMRGAINGTMLRNDGYYFIRLGQAVERIDSMARLIDVKYHVLLPEVDDVGSAADRTQWQALLHAASAQRAYAFVTKADLSAKGVARFLVMSSQFPRSIKYNVGFMYQTLRQLEAYYDREADCHQIVADFARRFEKTGIDEVISYGLHEFLTETVEQNYAVADALALSYGFGATAADDENGSIQQGQ